MSQVVSVGLDSSVPAQAVAAIANIVSGAESVAPNATTITVPSGASFNLVIVFATDAAGNVLLAGHPSQGGAVDLGLASTAQVMAEIALSPIPPTGVTLAQIDQAIPASAEYSNFLTQISTALSSGVAPANSSAVLASLSTLASQVQAAILPSVPTASVLSAKAKKQSRISSTIPRRLAATPPPLPYALVSSTSLATISLADNVGASGVNLSNNSMLQWNASTAQLSGTPITTTTLPGLTVWGSLWTITTTGALATPVALDGNGQQFLVGVNQNTTTEIYNLTNALSLVTVGVLSGVTGAAGNNTTCMGDALSAMASGELATLTSSPSTATLVNYIKSLFTPPAVNITVSAIAKCFILNGAEAAAASLLGPFVGAITAGVNVSSAFAIANQLSSWWGYSAQVEICKNAGVIVSCALNITAPDSFIAVGQSEQLTANINADGLPYIYPSNLTWTIPNGSTVATVSSSGLVTALAGIGTATIQVADPYSDTANITLTVGIPVISPQNPNVSVGQSIALALDDPNGNVLNLNPAWTWSSNNQAIATVDPTTGTLTGVAPGSTEISAQDPVTNLTSITNVTVSPVVVTASANPSSITSGGAVTLTAVVALYSGAPSGSPAPTGSVTFYDQSGATLCNSVLDSTDTATCGTHVTTTAPTDTITATYSGDPNYAPASGTTTVSVTQPTINAFLMIDIDTGQDTSGESTATITWSLTDVTTGQVVTSGSESYTQPNCQSSLGNCSGQEWGPINLLLISGHSYVFTASASGGIGLSNSSAIAVCTIELDLGTQSGDMLLYDFQSPCTNPPYWSAASAVVGVN